MPVNKDNAPAADPNAGGDPSSPEENREARNAAMDAAAGAPGPMRAAAAALPEKDPVQKAHKAMLTANDAQSEAKARAKLVDESPDAAETPSGYAVKKVAGIADDVKRGEQYAIEKSKIRHGMVPASEIN